MEGELSKIQPVAKRCVGGNWRNREGNEIWNSVTLLLPRVVWNWIFQVFVVVFHVYLGSLNSLFLFVIISTCG